MNNLLYAGLFCVMAIGAALAVELTGTTSVNMTSDTAASAKNKAFNSGRRDVIINVLRNYANPDQLIEAVKNSSNEELMNIISSSSLDSEKISDTTYSANISFVIDSDAARAWMEKYSVQNWLPTSGNAVLVSEKFVNITAVLLQPMADWMNLNSVSNAVKIDLATTKVVGNTVSFNVSDKEITKFVNALRVSGWNIQQVDNGLRIWK